MSSDSCKVCDGSGIALWVEDKSTRALVAGPFASSSRALDWIVSQIAQVYEQTGSRQLMRWYQVAAACPCKTLPAVRTTGYGARVRIGIPEPRMEQFAGMDWNSYPRDEVHAKAAEIAWIFAQQGHYEGRKGLILMGAPGTGKTGLAWMIHKNAHPDRSAFVDYSRLISFIQSTYSANALTDTADILRALQEIPLLVLDDFGDAASGRSLSDDRREKTYQILSVRHESMRPTVITTNLSWGQMGFQFGERIADRVRQLCYAVQIEGESLRR